MIKKFWTQLQCGPVLVEVVGARCGRAYTMHITMPDTFEHGRYVIGAGRDEVTITYDGRNIMTTARRPGSELDEVVHDGLAATIEYLWAESSRDLLRT